MHIFDSIDMNIAMSQGHAALQDVCDPADSASTSIDSSFFSLVAGEDGIRYTACSIVTSNTAEAILYTFCLVTASENRTQCTSPEWHDSSAQTGG